jgi:hypothetical protein
MGRITAVPRITAYVLGAATPDVSMPRRLYIYQRLLRFLIWNQAFNTLTGLPCLQLPFGFRQLFGRKFRSNL